MRSSLALVALGALAANIAVVVGAASLSAATGPGRPRLPIPDLGHLEAGVARQLEASRAALDAVLEVRDADPEAGPGPEPGSTAAVELADAYGSLGRLYFLYDLASVARLAFVNASTLAPEDFRWHYFLGVVAGLEGELEAASESLERALELGAGDAPTLIRLADAMLELNRLDEAESFYRTALEADPKSAAVRYGLGRVALARGAADQAIEELALALELQPQATSIHHSLGMAYRLSGDLDRARHHLTQNRGDRVRFSDPLVEELGRMVRSAQVFFNAGVSALKRGDYAEAIAHFREALVEKPDDYLIHYNLALAQLRLGEPEEAERELRAALELEPDYRNAHFNLATLLAGRGQVAEAETHFRRAHEIDPEDRAAHLEWATALALLGRASDAERELRALLVKHPDDPGALLKLAALQASSGRGGEAVGALRRVVAGDAEPAQLAAAHYRLGNLLEATDPAAALEEYRAAVESEGASLDARLALARLLGRVGRFADSARRFTEVVELEPELLEAHFGRAMALVLGDDHAAGRRALEASVALHADSVPLLHLLSRLLVASPDPAVRDGRRGLELAELVLRQAQTLEHAETMAMALAEVGRFEEAVSLQRQVIARGQGSGGSGGLDLAAARRRLALYEAGEPCRSPWKS